MAPISRFGSKVGPASLDERKAKLRALQDLRGGGIATAQAAPPPPAQVAPRAIAPGAVGPRPQPIQPPSAPRSAEDVLAEKRAAQEAAREKAKAAQIAAVRQATDDKRRGGFGGLIGQQEDARKATVDQQAVDKAQALQGAGARAGAMGLGLSGGTTALLADTSRTADRKNTLTLSDLDKSNRQDAFNTLTQEAALDDYEAAAHKDYNNDGLIGGLPAGSAEQDDIRAAEFEKLAPKLQGFDANRDGSKAHPFKVPDDDTSRADIEKYGVLIKTYSQQEGEGQLFQLPDGLFYYVGPK